MIKTETKRNKLNCHAIKNIANRCLSDSYDNVLALKCDINFIEEQNFCNTNITLEINLHFSYL